MSANLRDSRGKKGFFLLFLPALAWAVDVGQVVRTDGYQNARTSTDFRHAYRGNIKYVLGKGTKGEVEKTASLSLGTGLYVKLLNGPHRGESVWVYWSGNPDYRTLSLTDENGDETTEPDEARTAQAVRKTRAVRTGAAPTDDDFGSDSHGEDDDPVPSTLQAVQQGMQAATMRTGVESSGCTAASPPSSGSRFLASSGRVQSDSAEIADKAKELTAGKPDDRSKALAIYDWVIRDVSPNMAIMNSTGPYVPQTALQTFRSGQASCLEYSYLYAALLRSVGIPTKIILGTSGDSRNHGGGNFEPHAWNEVLIGGRWIDQDVTKDAVWTRHSTNGAISHRFFDMSRQTFGQSHHPEQVEGV